MGDVEVFAGRWKKEWEVLLDEGGDGGAEQVGWVFSHREKYTDCDETYLREAWVQVVRVVAAARPMTVASVAVGGGPGGKREEMPRE